VVLSVPIISLVVLREIPSNDPATPKLGRVVEKPLESFLPPPNLCMLLHTRQRMNNDKGTPNQPPT
jgi:hypothetical protein